MQSLAGANSTPDDRLEPLIAGYRVRPADRHDAFGLRAVELRAIRLVAARQYRPQIARSWARGLTVAGLAAAIEGGTWFELAADLQGHIVGFVRLGAGSIDGLFVEPDHMRHGIGSALLARAERRLQALGVRHVEANVPLGAVDFFTHRGYRVHGMRQVPTRGGFVMPVAHMGRDLS